MFPDMNVIEWWVRMMPEIENDNRFFTMMWHIKNDMAESVTGGRKFGSTKNAAGNRQGKHLKSLHTFAWFCTFLHIKFARFCIDLHTGFVV